MKHGFKCRALGDASFKEGDGDALVSNLPDVRHLALTPEDSAIVIASDGMFDVLADQVAAEVVLSFAAQEVGCVPCQSVTHGIALRWPMGNKTRTMTCCPCFQCSH